MASIISAGTTSGTSLNLSGDTSGVLQLASNGSTTAVTVDTSQNVGIGTASPVNKLDIYSASAIASRLFSDSTPTQIVSRASTDTGAPQIQLYKYRGTQASPTIVASGDSTGRLQFFGYDGAALRATAEIRSEVDGTPGSSDMPGRLLFYTTADGAASITERMRINSSGTVILQGGSTSATGTGITFPATQSASSDANTLDDYEEGTWTPNQGSGLVVVGDFSSSGNYTKIGNLVYIAGQVDSTTTVACNATGTITSNLPFTVGALLSLGGAVNATQSSAVVTYCTGTRMDSPNSIGAATTIFFSAVYRV
jgi:hypothetical protein